MLLLLLLKDMVGHGFSLKGHNLPIYRQSKAANEDHGQNKTSGFTMIPSQQKGEHIGIITFKLEFDFN